MFGIYGAHIDEVKKFSKTLEPIALLHAYLLGVSLHPREITQTIPNKPKSPVFYFGKNRQSRVILQDVIIGKTFQV